MGIGGVLLISLVFGLSVGMIVYLWGSNGRRRQRMEVEGTGIPPKPGYFERLGYDLRDAGIEVDPKRFTGYGLVLGSIVGLGLFLMGLSILAVVAAVVLGIFVPRFVYVSGRSHKRRVTQTLQIQAACRALSALVAQGKAPDQALEEFALRARPGATISRSGERDQVVQLLAEAQRRRREFGEPSDAAINHVSTEIANPYFDQFTIVWAQNLRTSNAAMIEGLEDLAEQIDRALVLRDKRIAAVSLPVGSYKLVGVIIVCLIGATMALLGDIVVNFYTSLVGQIATLIAGSYWFLGYWLQSRTIDRSIR